MRTNEAWRGKCDGHDTTRESLTKSEHETEGFSCTQQAVDKKRERERKEKDMTNMFRTEMKKMTDGRSCFVSFPFKLALNHSSRNMFFSL